VAVNETINTQRSGNLKEDYFLLKTKISIKL